MDRDLSPYEGAWTGTLTMNVTATDGSGLTEACLAALTFDVDPSATDGPPFFGTFSCQWEGQLQQMEDLIDTPVFAGGTSGLPALDGNIIYGPFDMNFTGTASETEWSGAFSGTYTADPSVPQLPSADISGAWTAAPASR